MKYDGFYSKVLFCIVDNVNWPCCWHAACYEKKNTYHVKLPTLYSEMHTKHPIYLNFTSHISCCINIAEYFTECAYHTYINVTLLSTFSDFYYIGTKTILLILHIIENKRTCNYLNIIIIIRKIDKHISNSNWHIKNIYRHKNTRILLTGPLQKK